MKIVKRCMFLVSFLLFVTVIYAQDEIYNEKNKVTIVVDTSKNNINEKEINNYVTEADYYAKQQKEQTPEVFTEDEAKEKRRGSNEAVQIAAEVVLEVFIHTVFIIATIWN